MTIKDPGAETRACHQGYRERATTNFVIKRNDGTYVIDEIGTEISYTKLKDYGVGWRDPDAARSLVACTRHYRRGDWDARVETELVMTSDKTHFHMEGKVGLSTTASPSSRAISSARSSAINV